MCGLVPYSGSDSDSPDEMSSPEHISSLPAISPFLCTDSSEAPDSSDGPTIADPYDSYPTRGGYSFWSTLRTHLNGPRTVRKRVGPLPARRLESRHASPRSSDHRSSSSSSSSDSSPKSFSAFRHWCAAPLSTLYPPTTSESSLGDSSERPLHSSLHSTGPSYKRGRSSVDYVPSSTLVMGSLAPTCADLLPPCKRFRDSYSSEASIEEDTEIDPIETGVDMELDKDEVWYRLNVAPIVFEEEICKACDDDPLNSFAKTVQIHLLVDDIVRIIRIDTCSEELVTAMLDIERDRANNLRLHMSLSHEEFRQVRRDRDDTRGRLRRTMTITHSGMTPEAIEELVNRRVEEALAAHEATRVANALETKNQSKNGSDGDNGNGRNGNGRNGNCRNENQYENGRGDRPVAR
ncbi:hypothetical protein Tco_0885611 [Tanacetum coccineum]